jgi:hypothetical protein
MRVRRDCGNNEIQSLRLFISLSPCLCVCGVSVANLYGLTADGLASSIQ